MNVARIKKKVDSNVGRLFVPPLSRNQDLLLITTVSRYGGSDWRGLRTGQGMGRTERGQQ